MEIFKISNGYWYWGRPSIEELRADLREIRRSVNPDWDLAAPGLREAWERGERDKFFPYGTSSAMSRISRVGTPRRSAAMRYGAGAGFKRRTASAERACSK